eukprot:scaffold182742_cov28-Prasinocladus_malaysianus.AAC.2
MLVSCIASHYELLRASLVHLPTRQPPIGRIAKKSGLARLKGLAGPRSRQETTPRRVERKCTRILTVGLESRGASY